MQIVQINLVRPQIVNFAPVTVAEEVGQNIYNLLATEKYTVPLDRNFGLSATFIDQPVNLVQAQIRAEILETIAQYEPRFTVQEINFEKSEYKEGKLVPVVRGVINGT